MALSRETGDRLAGAILLLIALPAMTAGIVVGVHLDDNVLVVSCSLIITTFPYFFRNTLDVAYERIPMFGRSRKSKSVVVLDVVAVADSNRVGTLEVIRGRFQPGDTLRIDEIYVGRDGSEEMTVKILKNGYVHSAGTLLVRNGTFEAARRLRVDAVNAMPVT